MTGGPWGPRVHRYHCLHAPPLHTGPRHDPTPRVLVPRPPDRTPTPCWRSVLLVVLSFWQFGPDWVGLVARDRAPARGLPPALRGDLGRRPDAQRPVSAAGAMDAPQRGDRDRPRDRRDGAGHAERPVPVPASRGQPPPAAGAVPGPGRGHDRRASRAAARARAIPPRRATTCRFVLVLGAGPRAQAFAAQARGPPRARPPSHRLPRLRSRDRDERRGGRSSARSTTSRPSCTPRSSTRSRSASRSRSGTGSTPSPGCARRRARSSGSRWTSWTARSPRAASRSSTARRSSRWSPARTARSPWPPSAASTCSAPSSALVILSPVLAVIAVAIALDGGRPVLFRQTRIGLHGRAVLASSSSARWWSTPRRAAPGSPIRTPSAGPVFKLDERPADHPRGRFLRRTVARRAAAAVERVPWPDEPGRAASAAARTRSRTTTCGTAAGCR